MNFGRGHYVPVLKVKRGEKKALSLVSGALTGKITPLLEIVELTQGKTLGGHLGTAFRDLSASVRRYSRCFLDAREIEGVGPTGAEAVFERASNEGIVFTPVTGVTRTVDVDAAVKYASAGIALRLTRSEFEGGGLGVRVRSFMSNRSMRPEETDLIVDLGAVDHLVADGVAAMTTAFLAEVPDLPLWRTLTVSGCAFPSSMGVVSKDSYALIERAEWLAWRDGLYDQRGASLRLPTFSDCAVQHPTGVEGFDPRFMPVSAAVRYARPEEWLLIKGESTRRRPARVQFPRLATVLVYGHLQAHYEGAAHCEGCRLMKAAADGAPRLGSAEAWRRLATIHHITTAVNGLSQLAWP